MAASDFVHVHVHSQYSLLDATCRIADLCQRVAALGMDRLALTDGGNLFGAIEFLEQAREQGIQPILGCEVYVAPGSRFERQTRGIKDASFHLLLLAKDVTGYRHLLRLVTTAYLDGFYYKPRVDKEVLAQHAQGLIACSCCGRGEVPYWLLNRQEERALEAAASYRDIFGPGNFFLELQDHGLAEEAWVAAELVKLGGRLGLPLVATNDVRYLTSADAAAYEVLTCLQTQTTLADPRRPRHKSTEFYLKSPEEMAARFSSIPEALRNTRLIAEQCDVRLDFGRVHFPEYPVPDGTSRAAYLRALCEDGVRRRYGSPGAAVWDRLGMELGVIERAQLSSYFLIAWDFIRHAKSRGIPVGPGRGSSAGCLVSYALGITDVDPLKYDLLFERFLNPDRKGLPDIDIDFCYERRGEVIEYVVEKYGVENVAQIITFGTMAAKAVIRDVGRVLGMTYGDVDRIAKLVPNDIGITLDQALRAEPELRRLASADATIQRLLETSRGLEGLARHASTHAAGVVISRDPLPTHIPLFKTSDGQITTGYDAGALEKIGLLKMDFLGLRTLTVIDHAVTLIAASGAGPVAIEEVALDDPATYALLGRAESLGVFQLESSGMRDLLGKLKPERFEDLVALLALYRPGPIGSGMVDDFIKRRQRRVAIQYDHPLLEPILRDTYGIIVYQEQIMRIVSTLAGFSLSQADSFRRAISKKTPAVIEQQREGFVRGARAKGIATATATKIFNLIEYFAGYGFNRSHSTAYALISYRTAYLKANHPVEFLAALLTSERDNTDKIALYAEEARRMGIRLLPPDVNASEAAFTVTPERAIRFGLAAIKNVGLGAIEAMLGIRRDGGPFASLYDLCARVDSRAANRKVLESLIKCGALDHLGRSRAALMTGLPRAVEAAVTVQKDRARGQLSFFGTGGEGAPLTGSSDRVEDWAESERLAFEKEVLGFYLSGHPVAPFQRLLQQYEAVPVSEVATRREQQDILVGGIVSRVRLTVTKQKNERMAIVHLEDLTGTLEVLVFPETFAVSERVLEVGAIVLARGRLNVQEDKPKLLAREFLSVRELQQRPPAAIYLEFRALELEPARLEFVLSVLRKHPGPIPVYLVFHATGRKPTKLLAGDECRVSGSNQLISALEREFGAAAVSLRASWPQGNRPALAQASQSAEAPF